MDPELGHEKEKDDSDDTKNMYIPKSKVKRQNSLMTDSFNTSNCSNIDESLDSECGPGLCFDLNKNDGVFNIDGFIVEIYDTKHF